MIVDGVERFEPASGAPARPGCRVVVVDNYDSFTFNLVQYLLELGATVDVVRNDALDVDGLLGLRPSHFLMSPGPGRPSDSGVCEPLSRRVVAEPGVPTLGVCLGHQTLCEVHGATVQQAQRIMHGKVSPIVHDGEALFAGIPSPYTATRYHSLIVDEATLGPDWLACAHTDTGELMAVRHRSAPVFGVQFHPESILTEHGHRLLQNFLDLP